MSPVSYTVNLHCPHLFLFVSIISTSFLDLLFDMFPSHSVSLVSSDSFLTIKRGDESKKKKRGERRARALSDVKDMQFLQQGLHLLNLIDSKASTQLKENTDRKELQRVK